MKASFIVLTVLLIAISTAFYFEYGKRSVWFSNVNSFSDPLSQREDFISAELDSFGFNSPALENGIVYQPVFTFQNKEGIETEFALTKLIFQDTVIVNGRELNNKLDNTGYTLVASPNEYYECSVEGSNDAYSYHHICSGCNLKAKQKSRKYFDSVRVGGTQMFPVRNGVYKQYGVDYVINAVVIPNYGNTNLVNLIARYGKSLAQVTNNLIKLKKPAAKPITDSMSKVGNINLQKAELISDQFFDSLKAQRLCNLKDAINNVFNEVSRPNQWGKKASMRNLVLPMISTGSGGVSYAQFFEVLFSRIKERVDSNKALPARILLCIYPGQKDLHSIKRVLGREILQFYEYREHKEVINKQRLSFLSRLIGILIGIISFFTLFKFRLIRFSRPDEDLIRNNMLLFAMVMIFSTLGLTLALKSYLDNLMNWEVLGDYFYLGLVGFLSLYAQCAIYKSKDIIKIFKT
ncbi:MAG: hypothetical protein ABIQ31_25755 [Ferruginibacter sp.]